MASAILQPSRVFQVEHPWRLGRQVLIAGPGSGPFFPSTSSSLLTALGLQLSYWPGSPVLYSAAPRTEARQSSEPLRCRQGLWATPVVLRRPTCQPLGSPFLLRVCSSDMHGPCQSPRGLSAAPAPSSFHPRLSGCSPRCSPGPTHTGWVMYTLCADVRGGVRIHTGYRSYIHCTYIYIYIQHIYIYLFTFVYILYRTLTFYQKQFCDFHIWPQL